MVNREDGAGQTFMNTNTKYQEKVAPEGLWRCFRLDQHVVGGGHFGDGDVEEGAEGGVPGVAAVEAKGEFVEIGLQVFPAQAVIDAECPAFRLAKTRCVHGRTT